MSRDPATRPSDDELRDEYGPRDRLELEAAARAVHGHRERAGELEALDGLSNFERALAEQAYRHARQELLDWLKEIVGPTAATVSADALRHALDHPRGGRAAFGPQRPPLLGPQYVTAEEHRAAEIVGSARRLANAYERDQRLAQERSS